MIKSIKNKFTVAVIFITLGLVLFGLFFFLIEKGARASVFEQAGKVNKIARHSMDPAMIIFGSSVSEVGIDPEIVAKGTKLSVYNCSLNGTRFLQYKGLIDEFSEYSKLNKYVVFVETYFSFEKIDALTTSEYFWPQLDNENIYQSLYKIQPDLVWKSRYIPFYKYTTVSHRYYKNAVLGWKCMLSPTMDNYSLTGYAPVDRKWEADADEAIRNTPKFDVQIDKKIVEEYILTIKELQSHGKRVILVLTPMFTEMLNHVTDISPLRRELDKISELTSAKFIDYSRSDICGNKEYFYNSNHLNKNGSKVFSTVLADSLRSIINSDFSNERSKTSIVK